MKIIEVSNKDTRKMPNDALSRSCSSVSAVEFEQISAAFKVAKLSLWSKIFEKYIFERAHF